ncbi:HAMP domain-containing histidine kinase [Sporolactobacillus shoreicorticis]|uniref:histidine kinase n=1 Tax=Sporolactobacillus shoreicorticis TaxID=1923877 RepID=A0ABW5S4L2_9BACL|nr:HAMP domain-containing sensor histidine kinase [Sporolactobacillus shoreicorticis]MCO7127375.1 HAMP domain-containing histidine kinase [Sporolactobacillus shoreicorticis]
MTLFRKTLIKLTILNSILLILLLASMCGSVYYYVQKVTYSDSTHLLQSDAKRALRRIDSGIITMERPNPMLGPPQSYIIVADTKAQKFVVDYPELVGSNVQVNNTSKIKNLMGMQEKTAQLKMIYGETYNVLMERSGTKNIYFIRTVDREQMILHRLFTIIIYGLVSGALVSVIVGFFLARRALRPVEKAWDRQNRFVADASHELRTPLSIIQLKIEGLLRRPRQKVQEVGEDIAVMLDETRRLSKLVGNLLTLARSDANRLEVSLAPLDLGAVLRKVTEPFSEMAEVEKKSFILDGADDPIYINGDEQRVHQLVVILLDNAMKFTPKGGAITVVCTRENKFARLSVFDSGCGISEQDVKHIFDRFYQVDSARTGQKGTGLGLSIAEWIVAKHRGKIDVESELGKGTTFSVRLPLLKNESELQEGEKEDDSKS